VGDREEIQGVREISGSVAELLMRIYYCIRSAAKQLKMGDSFKKSWPAHPSNTSSDILPLTSMIINVKLNNAYFYPQLNPLL
jgi:hypothetical protein